jgi:hypothetical protein
MIVIVKRADLPRQHTDLETGKVNVHHFNFTPQGQERAELIVFIDSGKVRVLKANKWPYGKPMSGADLLKYIANHVA